MNKQKKQMIILLIVMAVILAVFLLVKFVIKPSDEEEDETVALWSIDKDTVTYLKFTGSEEEIELTRGEDGVWTMTGHEDMSIDDSVITSLMGYIDEVKYSDSLADVSDLSPYGLSEPTEVVTFTADGTTYVLTYGDYNSNAEGRYILINDDPTVYVWDSSNYNAFSGKAAEDFEAEDVSSDDVSAE